MPAYMVELKGINMIRYFVDNSTWAVNVTLNNAIAVWEMNCFSILAI